MKANIFVSVNSSATPTVISPLLHGQFAEHLGTCIYGGIWKDGAFNEPVVEALAALKPPVLRWPGGCFADDYHWRDGIGPRESRPRTVNIHWGYPVEDNSFGTHEFIELCRRIGAEPYFAGNVGSGTVQEFRNWIEYCNFAGDSSLANERRANGSSEPFGVSWWGVGNENWGCGGNFCPEDYAVEYKRFATFLRNYPGTNLKLIACGPSDDDADWTRRFFGKLGGFTRSGNIHGFAAHYYTSEWKGGMGTSTEFTDEQYYQMLTYAIGVNKLIEHQRAIMDGYDPTRKVGLILDEWGTWHHPGDPAPTPAYGLYQQNAMRDALVAALTLDVFHNQADKLIMANIAQVVNVLQAMILTDENNTVVKTPTYHVFDLYQAHKGATLVPTLIETEEAAKGLPLVSGSASRHGNVLTLSLVNASITETAEVSLQCGAASLTDVRSRVLCADSIRAFNGFDAPETVKPTDWQTVDLSSLILPPASITILQGTLA